MITGSRKACKIRFPIFSLSLVLGSFYNIYFWRSGPKTEVRNSKGGAGVRELRVRLPPAARRARSYQHKGAAAGGRAPGRGFTEAPRAEPSGAARARRAERPGERWRCGGGDRGRRARRRGPRVGRPAAAASVTTAGSAAT